MRLAIELDKAMKKKVEHLMETDTRRIKLDMSVVGVRARDLSKHFQNNYDLISEINRANFLRPSQTKAAG